ncbi:uncharacterized protein LOC135080941 [Ostrinia nubilalis]|uniref:uncharacterized protein LOC135080941 n=1 Tax=Ostrinia nubilalis TaxID=29057 RepID=UPI0030826476
MAESTPDSSRPQSDHCEVSSSVGPYLASVDGSSSVWQKSWELPKPYPESGASWGQDNPMGAMGSGVIVDPIKTYHMGIALATRQTPFALLKPNNGTPVLVKVIDTKLPGGKQMLVPATAEDLKVGGKIVLKNDENDLSEGVNEAAGPEIGGAVQIRVPVVAIVVPKIKNGGRLHLSVEEPHHAYHTALSADGGQTIQEQRFTVGEVKVEPCGTPDVAGRLDAHDFDDSSIKSGTTSGPRTTG